MNSNRMTRANAKYCIYSNDIYSQQYKSLKTKNYDISTSLITVCA